MPECLSGSEGFAGAIGPGDFPAPPELDEAAQQGGQGDQQGCPRGDVAEQQGSGCQDDGEGQPDSPDVEGPGRIFLQFFLQGGKRETDGPGEDTGQKQDGEDPRNDFQEAGPETERFTGVHQRNHRRNQEGGQAVDHDHIGHDFGHAAPQPVGNDTGRRRCRADEAEHGAFGKDPGRSRRHPRGGKGEGYEENSLQEKQFEMPPVDLEVARRDFDELQEQHDADQDRLPFGDEDMQERARRIQGRREMEHQVGADSGQDGQGQHPVADESEDRFHFLPIRPANIARNS